jgi:[ribosomal protein S5]-alanine N-acetyltransferase
MLPAIPFGDTARLQLRPLVMNEARELLALVTSSRAELGRFMSWPREMYEMEHARHFVRMGREAWLAGRTVRLGVFERETGALAGSVELDAIDLRRSQGELGYWIRADRCRKGYATEAARPMLRYAFETLRLHKVRADVAVGNHGSARVLDKLGFSREGVLREDRAIGGDYVDHWRFGLLEREFLRV